ncbi:hypothetical protein [Kineobactrum salinum]|uniref:Porin n=1 Tax=Kineobactrum salinum TaxID=2708301 RepID=A0A6C0U260_9GAMM|nr:hypothetical protein [Kineobactrum salinum]QIB66242.1 hypothetical protein G3T16_13330 [Kineobactrum salinum]
MLIQPARYSDIRIPDGLAGVAALLLATAVHSPEAGAREAFAEYSLNGFGTLGGVYSSLDDADFRGSPFQPDGAGRTRSWAASVDSKLGAQLNAHVNPQWSAVLQVVAQYDYQGKYRPRVEWAYADYQVSPDLTIRLGRVVVGPFLESETRLVGYTYPWVRPPQEVYDVNPATNKDGIDLQYRFATGTVFNSLQLSYGGIQTKTSGGAVIDVDQALNLQYIAESGPATFKLGYSTSKTEISQPRIANLFDGMAQFGAAVPGPAGEQALTIANRYWGEAHDLKSFRQASNTRTTDGCCRVNGRARTFTDPASCPSPMPGTSRPATISLTSRLT